MSRPPPLQWLPAFEAAARLLSFSKAAAELHLTASAVSQQVKQLELHLGMPLFRRLTRRIELTPAGVQFAKVATQTLETLRQGHADLMSKHARPMLKLSMFPMVAHELVLPGLADFQAAHPDMDVHLDISVGLADFEADTVDAAIRCGAGPWPGLTALPLSPCQATIVASPELAARLPVRDVDDLRHHTLIHPRSDQSDWDMVAVSQGRQRIERQRDLVLDSDLASMHAAAQGLGVSLCFLPIARRWLEDGRVTALVPPVDTPMLNQFVFRADNPKRVQLMAFYDWIKKGFDTLQTGAQASKPRRSA